jgi:peptidyl-prolyl cis-trans isomerase SurA
MRFRGLTCVLFLTCAARLQAGEVLDRIVASVNGHVILQSDLDEELRYESLMSGHEQKTPTPSDRKVALDRVVDRELLSEQASTTEFTQTTADEIDKQLEQIKSDYAPSDKTSWGEALSRHGFTETEVRARIALELNQLKMIDVRLRPSVQIENGAIEEYYNRRFLPEVRRSGAQPVSFQEAAPKIREVLTQQRISDALASWLETLRSQAQIRIFLPDSSQPDQAR